MQDDFFCSASYVVHSADPFKGLSFLEILCDAFLRCHLLNQPFQHACCSFIGISQMSVKCSAQDEPLIQPRVFCLQIFHMQPSLFSNRTGFFIINYQVRIQHAIIAKGVGAAKFFIQGLHHRFLLQVWSFDAVKQVKHYGCRLSCVDVGWLVPYENECKGFGAFCLAWFGSKMYVWKP